MVSVFSFVQSSIERTKWWLILGKYFQKKIYKKYWRLIFTYRWKDDWELIIFKIGNTLWDLGTFSWRTLIYRWYMRPCARDASANYSHTSIAFSLCRPKYLDHERFWKMAEAEGRQSLEGQPYLQMWQIFVLCTYIVAKNLEWFDKWVMVIGAIMTE